MTEHLRFLYPERIHLVWIAFAVVVLLGWLELRGRDRMRTFLSATMQLRLTERATLARRGMRLTLVFVTLACGVLGLMRPQTLGGTETVSTRKVSADIMVVLDVSKSMLAEDAAPNRLQRAKAEVGELVDALEGHRVGLVAFAGRAVVLCPLTPDYSFFRVVLRGVDPSSVSRGGTRIGEAIRRSVAAFGPGGSGARVILLITDGEDHDSYPLDAAREALEAGVRIVSIGFGSEDGSEITLVDSTTGGRSALTDGDGVKVISRLDGELLREIALLTEGVYVPAGTAALDLESIIETHVEPMVRETDKVVRSVPVEHYPWFVAAALAALFASVWVGSTTGAQALGGESSERREEVAA